MPTPYRRAVGSVMRMIFTMLTPGILFFPRLATAQDFCGMSHAPTVEATALRAPQGAPAGTSAIASHGGCHLPASGVVRGLILYVQLRGDWIPDANWPLNQMPSWAGRLPDSLARYWSDMSGGRFTLELDTWPELIVTPFEEHQYIQRRENFGIATRELLRGLDASVDFTRYDNWSSDGRPYNVSAGGEGRVDLIIVMYRRITQPEFLPFSGVSDLGFEGYIFADSMRTYIYGGSGTYSDAGASGITVTQQPGKETVLQPGWAYSVINHELLHKVYGDGHPASLYGQLGVLANSGGGHGFNAFERHALGYMTLQELPGNTESIVTIRDYYTFNEACAIPLPIPNWYYILEYRNVSSPYDSAPARGLYIYRLFDSPSRSQKQVQVISAEGNFQWRIDSSSGLPVRLRPDALGGYSVFQKIPIDGKPYFADGWNGDPKSAFTLARPRFSSLGNPTPDFILAGDTVRTRMHATILDMTDSQVTVFISYSAPAILSLATPVHARSIALEAPWPNPVGNGGVSATAFTLPGPAWVSLTVHDAAGRVVTRIAERDFAAGRHVVHVDTEDLPSGMYWYVLRSEGHMLRRPVLVTR